MYWVLTMSVSLCAEYALYSPVGIKVSLVSCSSSSQESTAVKLLAHQLCLKLEHGLSLISSPMSKGVPSTLGTF